MASKVFIGVGHGGADPGAVAGGLYEKDVNLAVALACEAALLEQGVQVELSRRQDQDESLTDKIRRCNAYGPDLALDIHHNAGGGDGAEVYHHFGGGKGLELARNLLEALVRLGQNSRGPKTKVNSRGVDGYLFIRNTAAPAVIVESAFLDHPRDVELVNTPEKQQAVGRALAEGILKTLGLTDRPAVTVQLQLQQLSAGSRGSQVQTLQRLLNALGYGTLSVDGSFGPLTQTALKRFQQDRGLAADGIAGTKTWQSLLG